MSWRLVEGIPLPDAVGGHPALDFCNTRAGWGGAQPKEYLTAPHVLALWARHNGLSDGTTDAATPAAPGEDAALSRALALRDALYACALGRGDAADWRVVATEAADARAVGRLVGRPGAPARWAPATRQSPATAGLWGVALAAEDLLTSPLAPFVAACPGAGCGWVFADRRRKRRWCSMAACGNRLKARRHSARVTSTR